jgi:protein-tyrosine-phosphatase
MLKAKPSILFLSTGDSTRSRMAGAFFRKLAGERYDVVSTAVNSQASHQLAVVAMREAGIDISSELSTTIAETLKRGFTCVITICDAARERHPIFPFTPRLVHWSITDPASSEVSVDQGLELMRRVRDDIAKQVSRFIAEIESTQSQTASSLAGFERVAA